MFKKFKDKLAEEVKSSPQRIQQFAQAAQAAVTSASSSISDITNTDLFSIGDNESQKSPSLKTVSLQKDDVPNIMQSSQSSFTIAADYGDYSAVPDDKQRQRRLSNSSFASDVSFKLPSYESPTMYHFQSDVDVSASEAEERSFSSPGLDRVTKEQVYAAYRRTQDRYKKYRSQYADLARHYKILEREHSKARSVLVETQDKALRRISELREQCSLEQSAKAHLEKALRMEIDEKNIKIETLTTQVKFLQNTENTDSANKKEPQNVIQEVKLIDLTQDPVNSNDQAPKPHESTAMANKIEKMEQLINKYKDNLKSLKDKNSQLLADLQIASTEITNKTKEIEQLQITTTKLNEARQQIHELKELNEHLENKVNSDDFSQKKAISELEEQLSISRGEIKELQNKIRTYNKKEEEYAISIAENKLSIHKELEGKETEIKSLKTNLEDIKKELKSTENAINEYKARIILLEEEKLSVTKENENMQNVKSELEECKNELVNLTQKYRSIEIQNNQINEEIKCLELQLKQETAEKMAMIDRNAYLEDKIKQVTENHQVVTEKLRHIEKEFQQHKHHKQDEDENAKNYHDEINIWKSKCNNLESEIHEEREELIKLQSEIEKLLLNYESVQEENIKLGSLVNNLKSDLNRMKTLVSEKYTLIKTIIKEFRNNVASLQKDTDILRNFEFISLDKDITNIIKTLHHDCEIKEILSNFEKLKEENESLKENGKMEKENNNAVLKQMQSIEGENRTLQNQLNEIQHTQSINLEKEVALNEKLEESLKELLELRDINKLMSEKVSNMENENRILHNELKESVKNYQLTEKKLENTSIENENLLTKIESCNELTKNNHIINNTLEQEKHKNEKLETEIKNLLTDNSALKNQLNDILLNFNSLENELTEVKKSHNEIENQKDRLTSIIEVYEQNEATKNILVDHETQVEEFDSNTAIEEVLKEKCEQIKQEKETLFEKVMSLEQKCSDQERNIEEKEKEIIEINNQFKLLEDQIQLLKENSSNQKDNVNETIDIHEFEILKEENKRLQSDKEGLQTYLTKISKENSVLNDKLRETIASSEINDSKDELEISNLRFELNTQTAKIRDLERQYELLVEENLELKDAASCQAENTNKMSNLHTNTTDLEISYNNLLSTKQELENKFATAESMNKFTNDCVQQLQDDNHKLRVSNEKLERRLDEALVSLRHLHSLEENTELEYLRNVLYEYLTGPGTHSETLAKVLAAVVKFDDQQTKLVLSKEKERQGLLRQLGLL